MHLGEGFVSICVTLLRQLVVHASIPSVPVHDECNMVRDGACCKDLEQRIAAYFPRPVVEVIGQVREHFGLRTCYKLPRQITEARCPRGLRISQAPILKRACFG